MGFINKEKVLRGIGKAVDVTNEAADKVSVYVKEKELDKKALNAANEVGDAMKSAGKVIENKLSKLSDVFGIAKLRSNTAGVYEYVAM